MTQKSLKFQVFLKKENKHDQQKFSSNLLSNPNGGFLTIKAQKSPNNDCKCQKLKKRQKLSKNAKIRDVKILQDIPLHLEIIQ